MMETKAARARSQREKAVAARKMHAEAASHEQRAATLAHMIATMQAEMVSAMIDAALLRREARTLS